MMMMPPLLSDSNNEARRCRRRPLHDDCKRHHQRRRFDDDDSTTSIINSTIAPARRRKHLLVVGAVSALVMTALTALVLFDSWQHSFVNSPVAVIEYNNKKEKKNKEQHSKSIEQSLLRTTSVTSTSSTSSAAAAAEQAQRRGRKTTIFYSRLRPDRSGSAIQDMLLAHAYAFAHNLTYGGACSPQHDPSPHIAQHQRLIQALGLQDILRLACPDDQQQSGRRVAPVVERTFFASQDTKIWTPEWLDYIRSIANYSTSAGNNGNGNDNSDNPKQKQQGRRASSSKKAAVVHIRRGDVQPCPSSPEPFRYLPNSYYLSLIREYVPSSNYSVTIYSESQSFEPWDDFVVATNSNDNDNKNYTLMLDTDVADAWKAMMTADLLILSKSSFSLVPAIFNTNEDKVIYTDFWHQPLPHWTRVSLDDVRHYHPLLQHQMKQDLERLIRTRCK